MIPVASLSLVGFPAPQAKRPNIVLISIDTLRADHVSSYGYKRQTTPSIDALASEGVRFDQVTAAANSTLPSHMSMFTSLYPEAHGVTDRDETLRPRLSKNHTTLAEILKKAGYRTAAFVNDRKRLDPQFGFDRGFGSYNTMETDAQKSNDDYVLPWLQQDHVAPFFLFVHYYDAHLDWTRMQHISSSLESDYDQRIALMDLEVGKIVDQIEKSGHREDTIVVLVADHGQEFGEHGCFGSCSLHEGSIRVPWILSWPGHIARRVVRSPVQTIDLMPTLLDLAGRPASSDAAGRSRAPEAFGYDPGAQSTVHSTGRQGTEFSIRRSRWKMIIDTESDRRELYDLETDPSEARDLTNENVALARELAARMGFVRTDNRRMLGKSPPEQQEAITAASGDRDPTARSFH